jgi:hypothetical protein
MSGNSHTEKHCRKNTEVQQRERQAGGGKACAQSAAVPLAITRRR